MSQKFLNENPHRRYNPLLDEWILVSPHRTKRPWLGQNEKKSIEKKNSYETDCYLCPGNKRAGDDKNPNYEKTYVFKNDFSAVLDENIAFNSDDNLFKYESIKGECRVVCFSPRHDLTLPEMEIGEIENVINVWVDEYTELSKKYKWVQIFENKGAIMGCSNPHPHGQIWAVDSIPNEALKEIKAQKIYFEKNGSKLLIDYLVRELDEKKRIVIENENWAVIVPFWAIWPYETMILPKRSISSFLELTNGEKSSLAELLKSFLTKYDNLFETSFPYSMGWHNKPVIEEINESWQLHAHIYPPLLRSASVKKFMVGYELLSEAQRDITAEQAAATLREQSTLHYKQI